MFILSVSKEECASMPIYQYQCETLVTRCPYCGDEKGSPEGDYRGCCGESSAHYVEEECGHEYEVFYKSIGEAERDEPSEACPECGGTNKKRLISTGTSHILKGKGWAKDGY
jgi:predicted nucleic acid-binding Zn ribbon protein